MYEISAHGIADPEMTQTSADAHVESDASRTTTTGNASRLINDVVMRMATSRVPGDATRLQVLIAGLRVFSTGRQLLVRLVRVHQLLLLERGGVNLDGHGHRGVSSVFRSGLSLSFCVQRRQVLPMLQGCLLNTLLGLLVY
jgi:hypothetical protein